MDIVGKLIKKMEETRGESARGLWVRGGFVIETEDTYPRQVAFTLFGEDRLAMIANLQEGGPVQVTFSPESREYNGRWYTDLRCIRVVPVGAAAPQASSFAAAPQAMPQTPSPAAAPAYTPSTNFSDSPSFASSADDDLPF